ncbi:hypothetical protein ABH926_001574 [Catenulispora sp. GP43]|uniref:hypothetical protein n=1 Tax=Catenulispora sp. GP43 TaxID=3156263 RepID=UPI0035128040
MSSQPPWETQIQPGWGSQPPPEQPQPGPQQPQQGEGWNQGSYPPPQPPPGPPPQPNRIQFPQAQPPQPDQGPFPQGQPPQQDRIPYPQGQPPQPDQGPYPQFTVQPPPPQFTPPQMPGMPYPGEEPPPKKGNTGRILAGVAAVVVLLGAAGGIYVLTKGDSKKDTKAQPAAATSSAAPTTPASSSSASFPDNSYTGSAAPPASASSTGGGASLDNAATDKTPFTAQALVAQSFTDDKNVTYALKYAQAQPCAKIGDTAVQNIVKSAKCTDLMAASWIDPDNNRIVVSAMIIPYPDAATASAVYKKLSATHTGDYAQWCPPAGQPGADTCTKLAKAGTVTREGKFGSFHRYVLITTAVYVDLRNDDSQKDWLTSAAHGAFQNTLPGQ